MHPLFVIVIFDHISLWHRKPTRRDANSKLCVLYNPVSSSWTNRAINLIPPSGLGHFKLFWKRSAEKAALTDSWGLFFVHARPGIWQMRALTITKCGFFDWTWGRICDAFGEFRPVLRTVHMIGLLRTDVNTHFGRRLWCNRHGGDPTLSNYKILQKDKNKTNHQ